LLLCPFSLPTRNRPSTSTEADAGQDAARDRLADGLGGGRLDHCQQ
jgi:hypothetical protein